MNVDGDGPPLDEGGSRSLPSSPSIDINSDLGESFGAWTIGADEAVMRSVTSANVACGWHGGDPAVMRRTLRLARAAGVAVGAHPGLPDLLGFGRREMAVSAQDVEDMVLCQIGALAAMARAEGVPLRHVKAHGALYNMAARDGGLADAIARAVKAFDGGLLLFVLPGSEMERAGREAGLAIVREAFADRSYEPDGRLTPRSRPGAVLQNPDVVVRRAVRIATEGTVTAVDGRDGELRAGTICVPGDTPGADARAAALRRGLESAGVRVRAPEGGQ